MSAAGGQRVRGFDMTIPSPPKESGPLRETLRRVLRTQPSLPLREDLRPEGEGAKHS
jgi:hypothetical protein